MDEVDPRLVAALRKQLSARHGDRVGWKLGLGDAERIGATVSVGHLTAATLLEDGETYESGGGELHADAEIAVVVGAGYAPALELVDLSSAGDGAEAVVAANIFHRAVAFGPPGRQLPATASLLVNGVVRATDVMPDVSGRIRSADRVLAAVGERFEPGDRVITGSIVQVPVQPGDDVTADFGSRGRVSLKIA